MRAGTDRNVVAGNYRTFAASGNWARLTRGLGGLTIGGVLLWLALRNTSVDEVTSLAGQVQIRWVAMAMGLYWADLAVRTARWRALLQGLAVVPSRHPDGYSQLGEVLLVGYAVNNVLPARLGELFRADYAGKRLALNPMAVFGTIIIERLLDGIVVTTGLCAGLAVLFVLPNGVVAGYREPLAAIALCGAGAMTAAVAVVSGLTRYPRLIDLLPAFIRRISRDLLQGLGCLQRSGLVRVLALTLTIWLLEGAAIWSLANSAGVALGWWQGVVLVSALSLGTLVPTAPAYIGSYQLTFGLCLTSFGLPAAAGIFGATMVQVFLLAPVTIAGLLVYSVIHVSAIMRVANG